MLTMLLALIFLRPEQPREIIKPLADTVVVEAPKVEVVAKQEWTGEASYYSHTGCEGCHEQQIMANGEVFKEGDLTIAFNHLPLNSKVIVKNEKTGKEVVAKVTDTGGFNAKGRELNARAGVIIKNDLDRIADLSVGVKESIDCSDLCEVKIIEN